MKQVVSVSLGSAKRDHEAEAELLGQKFKLKRQGTDGSFAKAKQLIKDLDGKVDAIGLGGIDLYLYAENRRYQVRDAAKLAKMAKTTPVVDGSGLKNSLERYCIEYINKNLLSFAGKKVLMVSAVDRFGMAEALVAAQAKVTFGDLIFGLKIPIAIRSYPTFVRLAKLILPVATRLPFTLLYPTGEKQESKKSSFQSYFQEADIIAGDYLFISRYMPEDLKGKWIITNTITKQDIEELKSRSVKYLITTTPEFEGRSFGTNVLEGVFVALLKKPAEAITREEYLDLIKKLDLKPRVERLN